jgi:cell division protein FtsI/penicillin-binding protein 2
MAREISEALGGEPSAARLLEAMLPDATYGEIRTQLDLTDVQAARIAAFLESGGRPQGESALEIAGMWLEPRAPGAQRLCWVPEDALSEDQRRRHMPGFHRNPLYWSRFLADGLARCLWGDKARDDAELAGRRAAVWDVLMPSRHTVVLADFDASRAPELLETLGEQAVASHQMSIARDRSRLYPVGAFRLLGHWGYIDPEESEIRALEEMGFSRALTRRPEERTALTAAMPAEQLAEFERRAWTYKSQRYPASGIERRCDELLSQRDWNFLERKSASFTFDAYRTARGPTRSSAYFRGSQTGSEAPQVVSTLDAVLQRQVAAELDELMAEHRPALAMAIAVDVATGDVLALDAREGYQASFFAPVFHQFTPGSTAKVLVMACAIEAGAIDLSELIDVGHGGEFRLANGRVIHEAESSKEGLLTPAECLAHSVNAGLAQIGLRVRDGELHARFSAMGYGVRPGTGLGGESPGRLRPLPWKEKYTHTSFAFGHEWMATLWQHAAGLATVVRGGEWIPLRLVTAVEQNGWSYPLAEPSPKRVFSMRTCEIVRDMMALGAAVGTGASVASPEHLPGLSVGTKTGTAQKVPGEVCLHVEMSDHERHVAEHSSCDRACRARLVDAPRDHKNCYTSSMCIFGRHPDTDREVMVLVVADEPRGKEKFGSHVAGPTAVAILREALGLTALGEPVGVKRVGGFERTTAMSGADPDAFEDEPWSEEY